jgi:hypothetical protein
MPTVEYLCAVADKRQTPPLASPQLSALLAAADQSVDPETLRRHAPRVARLLGAAGVDLPASGQLNPAALSAAMAKAGSGVDDRIYAKSYLAHVGYLA